MNIKLTTYTPYVNRRGYIPTRLDDAGYLEEIDRERRLGMRPCHCSNCNPQDAARVIRLLPHTKSSNLNELLQSSSIENEDISIFNIDKQVKKRKFTSTIPIACPKDDPIRINIPLIDLAVSLVEGFNRLFAQTYPEHAHILPGSLFNREDAWQLVKNYSAISEGVFLREILGGQTVPGLFTMIINCIHVWFRSPSFEKHKQALEDLQMENDQEILNDQLLEDEHEEMLHLKLVEQASKAAGIAERKRLRLEKSARIQEEKEEKQLIRQRKLACKNMKVSLLISTVVVQQADHC